MIRLTRSTLRGIWVPLIPCWREDDSLDEKRYAKEVRAYGGTGIDGLYTGGTTGEFYAQDDATFEQITAITCDETHKVGLPVQIGCTALSTRTARQRIAVALRHNTNAIQIALPFWLELKDSEVMDFFRAIADAAGATPLVLYQTGRAKKVASPQLLGELTAACPTLIGMKDTGSDVPLLKQILAAAPDLSVFGGDGDIVAKVQSGGRGAYSAVACLNPPLVAALFKDVVEGRHGRAATVQSQIRRMLDEAIIPMVGDSGLWDSALDRLQRTVGGGDVGLRSQGPYPQATEEHVARLRRWCESNAPQLLPSGV